MKKILLTFALIAGLALPASALDFFSTAKPKRLLDLGARIGINTSNRTISDHYFNVQNLNSWGTGFDIGVIAAFNIRDFISIEPGLFFESRSGKFTYINRAFTEDGYLGPDYVQPGKGMQYNFTIPVMASFHFNVLPVMRWNVDVGPYFQINLKNTFSKQFHYPETEYNWGIPYTHYSKTKSAGVDVGLKFGTSLLLFKHYYVGVHYLAGFLSPWVPRDLGGVNKEWMFTIGYNL